MNKMVIKPISPKGEGIQGLLNTAGTFSIGAFRTRTRA